MTATTHTKLLLGFMSWTLAGCIQSDPEAERGVRYHPRSPITRDATEAEVRRILVEGTPYPKIYRPDGTFEYHYRAPVLGTYRTSGSTFCITRSYLRTPQEECFTVSIGPEGPIYAAVEEPNDSR